MTTKQLVVLSNEAQYTQFIDSELILNDFAVISDNKRFNEYLDQKNVLFESVDELLIQEQWEAINTWGCSQACKWINACQQANLFSRIDLPSVMYHFFSRMLIQMVKNYTYANHILDKYQPKSVVIFNGLLRYDYPDFSGNWYFNYFLDLVSKEKNIPIQHIDIDQKEQRDDYLTNHFSNFEQILRSWVIKTKKMVQSFYSGWTKPTNN